MRVFIGVFPPKEVLDKLRDSLRFFAKQKRNLKPIAIDQMHITLKYIGAKVAPESVDTIASELKRLQGNFGKFKAIPTKLQYGFKYDKFPKVLMVDIENTTDLLSTADRFHYAIKELGLYDTIRVKGKFSNDFHVTLARLKDNATRSSAKIISQITNDHKIIKYDSFDVTEAFLMESLVVQGQPPIYRKIDSFKL
jgi:2'-5' RNA ligase